MMSKNKTVYTKVISAIVSLVFAFCVLLCAVVVMQKMNGDSPSLFGYRIYMIISPSMTPTLPVDSVVIVKHQKEYNEDDIITFTAQSGQIKGEPNTHRIVDIKIENGVRMYQTKGDANNSPDDDWLTDDMIFGKVVKSFQSDFVKKFAESLKTPKGFIFVILIPIVLISIFIILDYVKDYKKAVQEYKEEEEKKKLREEIEKLKNKEGKNEES